MSAHEDEHNSSDEENDEDFIDPNCLCECLDAWFQSSAPKGVIMCSNTYSASPNPVLGIKDAGIVGSPLSHPDVDAVKQASHRAPFGTELQTIIDGTNTRLLYFTASQADYYETLSGRPGKFMPRTSHCATRNGLSGCRAVSCHYVARSSASPRKQAIRPCRDV